MCIYPTAYLVALWEDLSLSLFSLTLQTESSGISAKHFAQLSLRVNIVTSPMEVSRLGCWACMIPNEFVP